MRLKVFLRFLLDASTKAEAAFAATPREATEDRATPSSQKEEASNSQRGGTEGAEEEESSSS